MTRFCLYSIFNIVAADYLAMKPEIWLHIADYRLYIETLSQIPQWTSPISHNAPFCNKNVHTCAHFCYKMVHCGTWDWCIAGFVRSVYCMPMIPNKLMHSAPFSWYKLCIRQGAHKPFGVSSSHCQIQVTLCGVLSCRDVYFYSHSYKCLCNTLCYLSTVWCAGIWQ